MYLNTDLNNTLDLQQKLVITPQIQQALNVLHMNGHELSEYIQQQALENPVIELEPTYKELDNNEKLMRKIEWISSADPQNRVYTDSTISPEKHAAPLIQSSTDSLQDELFMQLNTLKINPLIERASRYIIRSLDKRGYLDSSIEDISAATGVNPDLTLKALRIIQNMEPWGVGARNLKECLVIQLKKKGISDPKVYDVIINYLDELSRNKLKQIAAKLSITVGEVSRIHSVIKTLNPYPGAGYDSGESVSYITPDVIVVKFKDYCEVLLNDLPTPAIRINNSYKVLLSTGDSATREYISKKMEQALFVVKCIAQRNKTLLDVSKTIVEFQKGFINNGPGNLAPMLLKDIAEKLNIHESTVSRAIHGKYIQCVWGVFEFKYFFSSGIGSSGNTATTQQNIKLILKKIIDGEDRKKPLSDQKLSELLGQKGILLSRRTVAKYRDEMKIPGTAKRRIY